MASMKHLICLAVILLFVTVLWTASQVHATSSDLKICKNSATGCTDVQIPTQLAAAANNLPIKNINGKNDATADDSTARGDQEEEESVLLVYHATDETTEDETIASVLARGGGSRGGSSSGGSRSSSSSGSSRSSSGSRSSGSSGSSRSSSSNGSRSSSSSGSSRSSSGSRSSGSSSSTKNSGGFFSRAIAAIRNAGSRVSTSVRAGVRNVGNTVRNIGRRASNSVASRVRSVASRVRNNFSTASRKFGNSWRRIGSNLRNRIRSVGSRIRSASRRVDSGLKRVGSNLKTRLGKIGKGIKSAATKPKQRFSNLYNKVKAARNNWKSKITNLIHKTKATIRNNAKKTTAKAKEALKKAAEKLKKLEFIAKYKQWKTKYDKLIAQVKEFRLPKVVGKLPATVKAQYTKFYNDYMKLMQERKYFFDFKRHPIVSAAVPFNTFNNFANFSPFLNILDLLPNLRTFELNGKPAASLIEASKVSSSGSTTRMTMSVDEGSVRLNNQCVTSCEWFGYLNANTVKKPYCEKCKNQYLNYQVGPSDKCYSFPADIHNGKIPLGIVNFIKNQCARLGACKCEDDEITNSKSVLVLKRYLSGSVVAIIDLLSQFEVEKATLVTASIRQAQAELQVKAKVMSDNAKKDIQLQKTIEKSAGECIIALAALEHESLRSISENKANIVAQIKNEQAGLEMKIKQAGNDQKSMKQVEDDIGKFSVKYKEEVSRFKQALQHSNHQCLKNFGIFMDLRFA